MWPPAKRLRPLVLTSFLVMGTAEPIKSPSSPSEMSPSGQKDNGPVLGRTGFLLEKKKKKRTGKSGRSVQIEPDGIESPMVVQRWFQGSTACFVLAVGSFKGSIHGYWDKVKGTAIVFNFQFS